MLTDTHTPSSFWAIWSRPGRSDWAGPFDRDWKNSYSGDWPPSCQQAIKIARKFEPVYAAVGIHPTDIFRCQPNDIPLIKDLVSAGNKVVAIGEIGLDLYWKEVPLPQQLPVFTKMLEIADELQLPVVIHNRNSHPQMRSFFEQQGIEHLKGVMHSFSGSAEDARFYLSRGLHISLPE